MKSFHIILAQKPFKGNFASNAINELPSGLNIDLSRIGTEERLNAQKGGENLNKLSRQNGNDKDDSKSVGAYGIGAKQITIGYEKVSGRFPANIILSHTSNCDLIGVKQVKSDGHWIAPTNKGLYNLGVKNDNRDEGNKVSDKSKETVENWDCDNICPIFILDIQSGITKRTIGSYDGESVTGFIRGVSNPKNQHGDLGGASRFFKIIKK